MKLKFLLLFFLLFFVLVSCSKDENNVVDKQAQVTDKQLQLAKQELLWETKNNWLVFKRLVLNDFKKELQKEDYIYTNWFKNYWGTKWNMNYSLS